MSAKAPRTSAEVRAELVTKRERLAALKEQLEQAKGSLASTRSERARTLAEGVAGPTGADVAALGEEVSGLTSAIELLEQGIAKLEGESARSAVVDAEANIRARVDAARDAAVALETDFVEVASGLLAPLADALRGALANLQRADQEYDRAAKATGTPVMLATDSSRSIMKGRGELMELVRQIRRYTETHPADADAAVHHVSAEPAAAPLSAA